MDVFFTYAIYNKERDRIYIGHTDNLENRLKRHNGLLPSKSKHFTSKNSGFWKLIHVEEFDTRKKAMTREKELKSFRGREFIKNLLRNNIN